jgi:broad specificity phosphatase PhoE
VTTPSLLVLARHGESGWGAEGRLHGRGDPPLTDQGRRQAQALGARLAATRAVPVLPVPDTAPLAIWHSPLRRATQTAQAIHEAREADAPLRPLAELVEVSQGEWEGLTRAEITARYPEQLAGWLADPVRHRPPGGEALSAAGQRAIEALDVILGPRTSPAPASDAVRSDDELSLRARLLLDDDLVARGSRPAWSIVVAHDGILRLLALALLRLGPEHYWSLPFAVAAFSIVDLTDGTARLRCHNLDEHLAAFMRP